MGKIVTQSFKCALWKTWCDLWDAQKTCPLVTDSNHTYPVLLFRLATRVRFSGTCVTPPNGVTNNWLFDVLYWINHRGLSDFRACCASQDKCCFCFKNWLRDWQLCAMPFTFSFRAFACTITWAPHATMQGNNEQTSIGNARGKTTEVDLLYFAQNSAVRQRRVSLNAGGPVR